MSTTSTGAAYARHGHAVEELAVSVSERVTAEVSARWVEPTAPVKEIRNRYAAERQGIAAVFARMRDGLKRYDVTLEEWSSSTTTSVTPEQLLREMTAFAEALEKSKRPFLAVKRLEQQKEFFAAAEKIQQTHADVLETLRRRENDAIVAAHQTAFNSWLAAVSRDADAIEASVRGDIERLRAEEPNHAAPAWRSPSRADREGVPQPIVEVGRVGLTDWHFDAVHSIWDEKTTDITRTVNWSASGLGLDFPLALDLDSLGGFVTGSRELVESAVVQLLSLLPPGMLSVQAVDPVGLGESLNFLYGLNEAGDKVLGDAVWTTAEQAARLLVELEKHVTFVTQKYLQGQHSTLTEYNLAAGEVAEPYRVVLLYDFPAMFTRDGTSWDEESMTRLRKLAGVGRRSGLYFFAVSSTAPTGSSALSELVALYPQSTFGARTSAPSADRVDSMTLDWSFAPVGAPDREARDDVFSRVLRGLDSQESTKVEPSRIAELARAHEAKMHARGVSADLALADPADASTWWRGSSEKGITSRFGRMGASGVAEVAFNSKMESSALIGGRVGSGKSFLLHSIVMDLITQYSPDELELYLIDLKEGVEFKGYADARLPHARTIAIESNREFAVSVLTSLDREITRRGELFKGTSGTTVDLDAYRSQTGLALPRVLLVIDEFHKLFEREDSLRREAEALLERLIKEGRAFGVHVILGSQSIALVGSAFRSVAGQIYYRLVLASSEEDSRILLGEGNPDAQLLSRAGEGIINKQAGLREANDRFQAAFWDPDHRARILTDLRARADAAGFAAEPVVFEGQASVSADSLSADELRRSNPNGSLSLPAGATMTLDPATQVVLERAPGANLLIIDDEGVDTLAISAAALRAVGIDVLFGDFGAFGSSHEPVKDSLADLGVTMASQRALPSLLEALVTELDRRIALGSYSEPARVLMLAGFHRARDFSPESVYDEGSSSRALQRLLKDGPEFGVFTIAQVDRPAALERRLSSEALREFGQKLLCTMSAQDSRHLIETDAASNLKVSEVILDDYDGATSTVLRKLSFPGVAWLEDQRVG
ncbi:FtsK/SpoIIIE domain-containing protein [Frondihabitans australicus]|uniref:FtsK/SpoIIIE domain-containing protein n=1 Tax=Frondihabitans australicus TaxID=386892 RepID=UPI001475E689|nr:FtsK/SpoIIIE domain-containing protein [Frondihabitans australicus]